MTQNEFLTKLNTAKLAISQAEEGLRKLVSESAGAPDADKTVASEAIRAAFSRLRAAQAKLQHIQRLDTKERLATAQDVLREAEIELDRVLEGSVVTVGAEQKWVSKVVEDAFAQLRVAKLALVSLKEAIARAEH